MSAGATHVVKQGEHLSSIAKQYGFPDYQVIWNHQQNASLKQKRVNPNVLFPGDEIFVPEKKVKELSCPTDQKHDFEVSIKTLRLKLELLRGYNEPFAQTPCRLVVEADSFSLTSDGHGVITHDIARDAKSATLTIQDKIEIQQTQVPLDRIIAIRIGELDPVEERSGQLARLANLGYYLGAFDAVEDADFESAVEEFQCENGLKVDGVCGPKTQAKLKDAHGC